MQCDHRANSRDAATRFRYPRRRVPLGTLLVLCSGLLAAGDAVAQKKKPAEAKAKAKAEDLLSVGAFPKLWKHVSSDKKAVLANTWHFDKKPKIPELNCTGKPPGYVRTAEEFTNFDLTLEWQFPKDEDCNSGILVHCGEDKVWPASIQVQLHRPFVGSIFPSPGAKTASEVKVKSLKLASATWHKCRIRSVDGTITVWINDKLIGAVAKCEPSSGYIGLQSEGFPIKFRRFEITRLKNPEPVKPKPVPATKVPPPKVKAKSAER